MLFTQKSEIDIHEMSPLALAFVGDAVLELLVRARLVGTTRLQPNRLHTVATHYVSAHAQNLELDIIEPMLTDAEAAVLRRGKNASKATVAKHATAQNGWCAVLVDGFPLGGGKVSGGRIKNHYPKGLRNLQ